LSISIDLNVGKSARIAGVLLALAAALVSGCGGGSSSGAARADASGDFASMVNDHRDKTGCPRLVWDHRLAEVAKAHSDDMLVRKYVSHVSPDGVGFEDRLNMAGYSIGAENIAAGYGLPEWALEAWKASPPHRANLDNCAYVFHGAGVSEPGGIWTHMLAR
jgi:uncharacterized protein YkwD